MFCKSCKSVRIEPVNEERLLQLIEETRGEANQIKKDYFRYLRNEFSPESYRNYQFTLVKKVIRAFEILDERVGQKIKKSEIINKFTSYRIEYVCACIKVFNETLEKDFWADGKRDHPFINGGIPLREETREQFNGVIAERGAIIPLFGKEKPEKMTIALSKIKIGRKCACGATEMSLANTYYRDSSHWCHYD